MSIPKPNEADAELIRNNMKRMYNDEINDWSDAMFLNAEEMQEEILPEMKEAIASVHPDVTFKFLGCGDLSPGVLEGLKVAELGCGNGRDAFAISKLIGERGRIIGIDLAEKEIAFCEKYKEYHREKYGYAEANTEFVSGSIEDLGALAMGDNVVDLVYSNGAVCLVPDKNAALSESYRILKDGGEFHMMDIFAGSRPNFDAVRLQKDVWSEAAGAAYWQDFVNSVMAVGYTTPRVVCKVKCDLSKDKDTYEKLGQTQIVIIGYRMFRLPSNASRQPLQVTYNGGISGAEQKFNFDKTTVFQTGVPVNVDGELAAILTCSRFAPYFTTSPLPEGASVQTKDPMVDPFTL